MDAPIPFDDVERLAEVHALLSVESVREERFSRVTRMACKMFDVPVAMVAWMGREKQIVKGVTGFDINEAPRNLSFCSHTIYQNAALIVEDTLLDERFVQSPWVKNAPHVRFYAGYPVRGPRKGDAIGTVCLYDMKPRTFDQRDVGLLRDIALQIEESLVVDWSMQVAERSAEQAIELSHYFESTTELVVWSQGFGEIVYVNAALLKRLGYQSNDERPQSLKAIFLSDPKGEGPHSLLHRSGSSVVVKGTGIAGTLDGKEIIRWTFKDMSKEVARESRLRGLAESDELTEVYNRRGFMRRLEECLQDGIPFCLAMLDLDHLKLINDKMGHQSGDKAIVRLARCLLATTRSSDIVGRLGGDEFCVALPGVKLHRAHDVFHRLHSVFKDGAPCIDNTSITVSVGVIEVKGGSADEALARADERLYVAKAKGRNRTY